MLTTIKQYFKLVIEKFVKNPAQSRVWDVSDMVRLLMSKNTCNTVDKSRQDMLGLLNIMVWEKINHSLSALNIWQ